jgi:hypothetical protein
MRLIIDIDDEMVCNDIKNKALEPTSATDEAIINALYNGTPVSTDGDLISREALKKALNANCDTLCPDKNTNWCEHCCPHNDFEDLIDNDPTVELTEEQAIDKLHETGWLPRHDKEMTERPQGEWLDEKFVAFHLTCNKCGCNIRRQKEEVFEGDYAYNFCPNCGAKMGGST